MTKFACEETFPDQTIEKVSNGYCWSLNYADFFQMFFDNDGNYTHQFQEDMINEGLLRIVSQDVEPLTKEQMRIAIDHHKEIVERNASDAMMRIHG